MKKELLLQGADLLEANANNPNGVKIDLAQWTDCAIGLFAISGEFPNFSYEISDGSFYPIYKNGAISYSFDAVSRLFEISFFDVYELFSPRYYEVKKGREAGLAVAARIRKYVANGRVE